MAIKDISTVCGRCGGDGMEEVTKVDPPAPPVSQTCGQCGGVGRNITGQLDDDLIDFLNDLKNKVEDIKEVVDEL